ncbi:MAG TPA: tRNA (cytidine(56)-2'-O)-methyltransferase [Thermoplasmata archaeon]|nr:tRNA (cytidine(56)-2'-O)-methyltransferase [Thermoplasmata archaeon]
MPAPARRRGRPDVAVLRVGHRPGRDPRLTTHLALAARALGASRLFLHPPDPDLSERIAAVSRRWGGTFDVVGVPAWKSVVEQFRGGVVHLTMYGEPLTQVVPRLRRAPRLLVVVGGAKVPPALFGAADHNVAVGSQPHSEVAALAILLDRLLGPPSPSRFRGAEQRIVPRRRGKRVLPVRRRGRR